MPLDQLHGVLLAPTELLALVGGQHRPGHDLLLIVLEAAHAEARPHQHDHINDCLMHILNQYTYCVQERLRGGSHQECDSAQWHIGGAHCAGGRMLQVADGQVLHIPQVRAHTPVHLQHHTVQYHVHMQLVDLLQCVVRPQDL